MFCKGSRKIILLFFLINFLLSIKTCFSNFVFGSHNICFLLCTVGLYTTLVIIDSLRCFSHDILLNRRMLIYYYITKKNTYFMLVYGRRTCKNDWRFETHIRKLFETNLLIQSDDLSLLHCVVVRYVIVWLIVCISLRPSRRKTNTYISCLNGKIRNTQSAIP